MHIGLQVKKLSASLLWPEIRRWRLRDDRKADSVSDPAHAIGSTDLTPCATIAFASLLLQHLLGFAPEITCKMSTTMQRISMLNA
jgi:hypothetical protein